MLNSVTLTEFGYRAIRDGVSIDVPNNPDNNDYQLIQEWIAKGGIVAGKITAPTLTAPDWLNWRLAMMADNSYNDLSTRAESSPAPQTRLNGRRLENTIALPSPHLPTIQTLWGNLLKQTLYNPSTATIAQWKALATQYRIPFTFDDKGAIVLL